jgi:hypothetical protein
LEQFVECADHLGQFNAHWPEHELPTWEWLNHIGMRTFFRSRSFQELFARLQVTTQDPLIRRILTPANVRELLRLWNESESLLARTEDAPRGICHGNCHSRNLFPMQSMAHGSITVAIDWVKVGVDAYGEDIGHLLGSAIGWNDLTIRQARSLVDPLFHAYVKGLQKAGWSGNEEQVRLTFLARLACEAYRIVNRTFLFAENAEFRSSVVEVFKLPAEVILDLSEEALHFYFDCKNQAVDLATRI